MTTQGDGDNPLSGFVAILRGLHAEIAEKDEKLSEYVASYERLAMSEMKLKSRVKELEAALEEISATRIGPELEWDNAEMMEYWSNLALQYRNMARSALAKLEEPR